MPLSITIYPDKTVLSGEITVYKTERFIRDTIYTIKSDAFISKIAESIILNVNEYFSLRQKERLSFLIQPKNKAFSLFFRFGIDCQRSDAFSEKDLIFYKFIRSDGINKKDDRILSQYVDSENEWTFLLSTVKDDLSMGEKQKIYKVYGNDVVNFPLLNEKQRKIVETENKNMLVQGIAGSGKTNVCIDKIIFCACRNYFGQILYTTYSRGLLTETKNKVEVYKRMLIEFLERSKRDTLIFTDKNHKKAIENRLGIYFSVDDDHQIFQKIQRIIDFLSRNVEYKLIEDLYPDANPDVIIADEGYFIKNYLYSPKFRLSGTLERIRHLSAEIIYKEIYGMITGRYDVENDSADLTREEYARIRENSFSRSESDAIFTIASDYVKHLSSVNAIDNNEISRRLMVSLPDRPLYSVAIIDEVQDFTQINLALIKKITRKMFCVGDALQMINPSYFSFAYLKRLMYEVEGTSVSELRHNYRSTASIEKIIDKVGELNVKQFGTHNFVLKGEGIKSDLPTATVYVENKNFIRILEENEPENITIVVSNVKKKEDLRKRLKKAEILTVSEIKGLERNSVVLYDCLSDNSDKWHALKTRLINRKTADENSAYRYYFNLFYVGVSRATQYLFVIESEKISLFEELFNRSFDKKDVNSAIKFINEISIKTEISDDEIAERINQFITLGQYDNALFSTERITDENLKKELITTIEIEKRYVKKGLYREAGIEFWQNGYINKAKKYFLLNNDDQLCKLVDATVGNKTTLDIDIVRFLPDCLNNKIAVDLIIDTVWRDYNMIMDTQTAINNKINKRK